MASALLLAGIVLAASVSVFADGSGGEIEQLDADVHGRWRQAARAVVVLLSAHGLPPAQIAALVDCHVYLAIGAHGLALPVG